MPTDPGSDEHILLELVDAGGGTIGTAEKLSAHRPPGRLHRAFSVFLFDRDGRMLLQRRALSKYHSPGVWSNACCGHPFPGEPPARAAARRTSEELGVAPVRLADAGTVTYRLPDPDSGLVEHEYNHLFAGEIDAEPRPDGSEVVEVAFVTAAELAEMSARLPFSVWFPIVFEAVRPRLTGWGAEWRRVTPGVRFPRTTAPPRG
ncbi:isopentenyl-diphosphate Delta-isomerase [Amycolatopsis anabasis]|uniref:isopentenyl-diphosphate Delta-isomerase n=1 Tax=Amycolatopsis anabasis TaxID=1840409 RepID=UPI00131C6419|nr:isopentenyl-diphosphate Delta-isomerase [Amycolatopsis anabasis]